MAVATAVTILLVVAIRVHRLDDLPGEWYGDISTLYEYALSVRDSGFPAGLYVAGAGPLYPLVLAPLLLLLGASYLVIKLVAVGWSLAGLAAIYWLCFLLRGTVFALVATLVAGTGSWLLVFSRLGDLEAAVPFLAIAPLALAVRLVESPPADRGAAFRRATPDGLSGLCGLTTGASLYLYGAAFAVPILVTVVLAAASLLGPRPRLELRRFGAYLAALALALAPLAINVLRSPEAFAAGHFATRLVRGPDAAATAARNFGTAMSAYTTAGDLNSRGNPAGLPHLDRLSLALAIAGVFAWAAPAHRRWGAVLVGGFLLMHLPAALAREGLPSASRTIGAAPYAYLLVAGGIVAITGWLSGRLGRAAGIGVATGLAAAVAAINIDRYFRVYAAGLPYGNVPIARRITDFVDRLPAGTAVYLVGSTWAPGFMPEPKSIRYTMREPGSLRELAPETLDCPGLAALERPGVLIWSYRSPAPSPRLTACVAELEPRLVSERGLPLYHTAALPERAR